MEPKKAVNFFQYEDGSEVSSTFDFNKEKQTLVDSLNKLKAMTVTEFTFYKKWEELQQLRNTTVSAGAFNTKERIWKLIDVVDEKKTIEQIESIDPEVIFVGENNDKLYADWYNLRMFCHTMEFNQNPGRFLRFIVRDKISKQYLGALSVASDVITITDRDKYIGWNQENRINDKRLAHSAIGSCIMATQPFGYNFLGGKLMACLVTSKTIRDKWEELYNQKLVGMTTTSLYGSFSMYNNLKWWHKCGSSAGKILIKPDQSCYSIWHEWLKINKKDEYVKAMTQKEGVSGPVTGAKLKTLSMVMSACDLKQKEYVHGHQRGSYYSCFYENTKEFLQNKIKEDELKMKSLFKDDVSSILEWWKPKAIERYKRLLSEGKARDNVLYYDRMLDMSYEKAKETFFFEVGQGK